MIFVDQRKDIIDEKDKTRDRADNPHTEGGRHGASDRGDLPQAQHQLAELLPLEEQVRRHGSEGGSAPPRPGEGEHRAQEAACRPAAQDQGPGDRAGEKPLSPERRRGIAAKVQSALSCSGRAVCRWLGISRSTLRYLPKPKPEGKALRRNRVRAWGLVSDYAQRGGKLRAFDLIGECARQRHCIHADRAIKASDALAPLQEAIREHGAPECIRSGNGPELIAKAIQGWLAENGIEALCIDPGRPWRNGYAESFNGRFREERLDRELICALSESRVIFADWKDCCSNHRPHGSPGALTPSEFATRQIQPACGSDRPSGDLHPRQLKPKPNNKKPVENLSFKPG